VPQIQLVCFAIAISVLLSLSFFFGWRQLLALRSLGEQPNLPVEESRYQRRQAYRRLIGCGLMVLLALLLAGWQIFLEDKAQALAVERDNVVPDSEPPPMTEEQRDLARLCVYYWIVILLVLLTIVALAGVDMWTTRRRGLREHRKILDDQRIMLERQVARYREGRNGHN